MNEVLPYASSKAGAGREKEIRDMLKGAGATNWNWGFWLGSRGASWGPGYMASEKTELAAKNKLLSAAREWLQQAGIK